MSCFLLHLFILGKILVHLRNQYFNTQIKKALFTHSLIQQVFVRHLVCGRQRSKPCRYTRGPKKKKKKISVLSSFSAVQVGPTLCNPMDCSTPGFPFLHRLPESTQTHVHGVSDAVQPSHPLSPPSPPALGLPQHQCLV